MNVIRWLYAAALRSSDERGERVYFEGLLRDMTPEQVQRKLDSVKSSAQIVPPQSKIVDMQQHIDYELDCDFRSIKASTVPLMYRLVWRAQERTGRHLL